MSQVDELALRLAALERSIVSRDTTPQLAYSSIEDGAILSNDIDGQLRAILGKLPDGTTGVLPVNGPPPPIPSIPRCSQAPHGYVVEWDGFDEIGSDIKPLDWSRVEIHSAVTTGFSYSPSTLRGTFESPQGGMKVCIAGLEYELGLSDTYEVLLVARNTSGTASSPSGRVAISVGQIGTMDIADFSLTVKKVQSLNHQLY